MGAVISDDFLGASINSTLWTSIPGAGTISVGSGALSLAVPNGSHDPSFGAVNNSIRIMQTITDVPFTVILKVNSPLPGVDYQFVGVIIQQDSTHYMRLEIWSSGGGFVLIDGFKVDPATGNTTSQASASPGSISPPLWLKIDRTGTTYTMSYSLDGSSYTAVGSPFTYTDVLTQIGVYAGNFADGPTNTYTASIDFFNSVKPVSLLRSSGLSGLGAGGKFFQNPLG